MAISLMLSRAPGLMFIFYLSLQRIIAEHKVMMRKMEENLEQEKQRQLSHLDEEIKRRREKKERKRRKQLEEEEAKAVKADDENERQQMQEIRQKQAEQLQQQLKHAARPSTPVRKGSQLSGDDELIYTEQPASVSIDLQLGDADLNQLLISTPLFGQLTEIHTLLQLQTQQCHNTIGGVSKAAGGDTSPYIDLKDAQWECKGDLLPVKVQELKPSDFVVYRFGMFVANLICKQNQLPGVSMLIASNLPPNNYTHNCFRNSFFYEHSMKTLYIRKERLESVGEFVVVIMHCLSHIRVGDLADDSNPLFLREFYQVSDVNHCESKKNI